MNDEEIDPFPLHTAAREGNELAVRSLVRSEPSLISKKDNDGRTPIFWAVSSGNIEITQTILSAVTKTSLKGEKTLERINIDDTDEAGWTIAHIVASIGSQEILELLLQYDPDLTKQTNAGQTPLHYAVSRSRFEVAERLIEVCPAAVRVRDKQNQVPLHRAAAVGNVPLMNLLIKARSPLNTADKSGWTPLFHAAAEGHGDAALVLIRAGADTSNVDPAGQTFLDVCPDEKVRKWISDMVAREGLKL
ncbi:ankyrin repeat-containing domain protein [Dipodascopsis uninucleata]